MKNKKILIIGAGIHGCFLAYYLSKLNFDVVIVDQNKSICNGTSASTHNRANRGYHYPRSQTTLQECMSAYDYFKKNYKKFLVLLNSYYCIEKNSKTKYQKYINIFKKNNLFFKKITCNNYINTKLIDGIIKAKEGCFDHKKITNFLNQNLKSKKIKKILNFKIVKVFLYKNNIIIKSDLKKIKLENVSYIINSTYDNALNILKLFGIKSRKKYIYQTTEIPVVYSKKKIPGITIMDGPFATIMPYAGKKNHYLLYDVENSIIRVDKNNFNIKNKIKKSNFPKIFLKIEKYINFTETFKYKFSLYGKRPIPINCKGDDRSTKVQMNNIKKYKLFTIFEGKYISAPFEMNKLAKRIAKINEN